MQRDGAPFGKTVNAIPMPDRVDRRTPEERVFGDGFQRHPVTQLPLEQGQNALPADEQAWQHCVVIEQQQGILAADVMRERVKAHIKLRTEAHNVAVKAALEQIK